MGERAQEPGLSQGGAIANSLLKVIYDFENDETKVATGNDNDDFYATENLFEDDDDNDDMFDEDDESFGELEFDGMMSGNTLSWAELLRRMKDEMEAFDYAQVPTLSTSRRFDLNDPVYLLPQGFNPEINRKFSLLIGCNYNRELGALKKSHDDIHMVKDYIVNVFGFPEDEQYMTVLLDDKKHKKPTYKNILQAMKFIALRSRPGDAVFIQFSGHGGRVKDLGTRTADCYDEVIVPCDFQKRGFITDKSIFKTLFVPMAEDVTVTIILDSCDTGIMLDLPYAFETKDDDIDTKAKVSLEWINHFLSVASFLDISSLNHLIFGKQNLKRSQLKLNDCFSFMRFLNVVKQLYDTSVTNQEDDEESDADSIATMGHDDDGSDDEMEAKKGGNNNDMFSGFSAKDLMKKIESTMKVVEEEAEYAGDTAIKMFDVLVGQVEERNKLRSRESQKKSESRVDYEEEGNVYSSYDSYSDYNSSEDDDSYDSYGERARSSRRNYGSKKQTNQRSRNSKSRW